MTVQCVGGCGLLMAIASERKSSLDHRYMEEGCLEIKQSQEVFSFAVKG